MIGPGAHEKLKFIGAGIETGVVKPETFKEDDVFETTVFLVSKFGFTG